MAINVEISYDKMSAYLNITGANHSFEEIIKEIDNQGIVIGLKEEEVKKALEHAKEKNFVTNILIAEGLEPERGNPPTTLKLLIDDAVQSLSPVINDRGVADFTHSKTFKVVQPGEHLMRKVPGNPGRVGTNLFGEPVVHVDEQDFANEIPGAIISEEDPNLLIAAVKGHPVVMHNGVKVDEVMVIKRVNIASGNVKFDGSVRVLDDVENGFSIDASGDVIVEGIVSNSSVKASGSITIHGGVMGNPSSDQTRPSLVAGGSITAKFLANVDVKLNEELYIEDHIYNCNIVSGNNVVVGNKEHKGAIIGGKCMAKYEIQCKQAGSPAGFNTWLEVGSDPKLLQEYEKVSEEISNKYKNLEVISQELIAVGERIYNFGAMRTTDKRIEQAFVELHKIIDSVSSLRNQKQRIKEELHIISSATINILDLVHGGTHFKVKDWRHFSQGEEPPAVYSVKGIGKFAEK